MKVSILAISTATPKTVFTQEEIAEKMVDILAIDSQKSQAIRQLYLNSCIRKRYSVVSDFKKERKEWNFWGEKFPQKVPTIAQRNEVYKVEAPKLACEAAEKAIKLWNGNPQDITHVISVSCT